MCTTLSTKQISYYDSFKGVNPECFAHITPQSITLLNYDSDKHNIRTPPVVTKQLI